MKESMWGYYLALLGITVSTVMIMVSNMTTTNNQNYYLLREVTNAAMIDAIDFSYYAEYGETKINTEKFVENFLRRFSEGISKTNTYKIDFYSIYENPPSVSIKVTSNTGDYTISGDTVNIDVVNSIDAIMESNNTVISNDENSIFTTFNYETCDESNYITSDKDSSDYGYCRTMTRLEFNLEDNSDLKKDILNKIGNENFDISKLNVLNSRFLTLLNELSEDGNGNKFFDVRKGGTTINLSDLGYGSSSTYTYNTSITDVTGIGNDESFVMAQNVRNVNLNVVKQEATSTDPTKFFLAYSYDYNCKDKNDNDISLKTYRKIKYFKNGSEVSDEIFNNDMDKGNYQIKINHLSEEDYNKLSEDEKKFYKKAPYYNACVIGLKYKVDFSYDNAG